MAKYYCPECKSELITDYDFVLLHCSMCDGTEMQPVPEWETPQEYEKRTGREWKGAVWKGIKDYANKRIIWNLFAVDADIILCANNDTPPPDDFGKE